MAITLPSGFIVTNQQPIDSRLVLSKAEMVATVDARMPQVYMCMCKDDGKIYIYNVDNTVDVSTGKFRKFEGGKTYTAGDNVQISLNDVISATDTKIATSITLGKAVTSRVQVGGISVGKTYAATNNIAQIIEDLLGASGPTPVTSNLYYSVGSTVPTSIQGMTSKSTNTSELKVNGYVWKDIALNNEYPFLAVSKDLGVACYEIVQNGFTLGFNSVDLGEQILYYPTNRATINNVKLTYHFE